MAGYYKAILHAPLVIKPVNLMEEHSADGIRHDARGAARPPGDQVRHRGGARAAQGRDAPDPRRFRRAAGQVRRLPRVRRSALARAVHAETRAAGTETADRPPKASRAHGGPEEMAGAGRQSGQRARAMPSSRTTSSACAICSRTARTPTRSDGEGYTPLINATRFGFVDVATYLAGHKADVNLGDRNDWTPLMYAAWQDDPELVSMLIGSTVPRSTSIDNDGLTPLGDRRAKRQDQGSRGARRGGRGRQCARGEGRLHAAHAGGDFRLDRPRHLRSSIMVPRSMRSIPAA